MAAEQHIVEPRAPPNLNIPLGNVTVNVSIIDWYVVNPSDHNEMMVVGWLNDRPSD
jgi:hypothetical protein